MRFRFGYSCGAGHILGAPGGSLPASGRSRPTMQGDRNEPDVDPEGLLISDADRDQISAVLGEHMAEGRLTADELDQRVGRLFECRTRGQAAAVMAGLPALEAPEQPRHFHAGPEHDDSHVALPSWMSAGELVDSVRVRRTRRRPPRCPQLRRHGLVLRSAPQTGSESSDIGTRLRSAMPSRRSGACSRVSLSARAVRTIKTRCGG